MGCPSFRFLGLSSIYSLLLPSPPFLSVLSVLILLFSFICSPLICGIQSAHDPLSPSATTIALLSFPPSVIQGYLPFTLTTTPILVIPEPNCSWHLVLTGVEGLKQGCVLEEAPMGVGWGGVGDGVEAEIHPEKKGKDTGCVLATLM